MGILPVFFLFSSFLVFSFVILAKAGIHSFSFQLLLITDN